MTNEFPALPAVPVLSSHFISFSFHIFKEVGPSVVTDFKGPSIYTILTYLPQKSNNYKI